MKLGFVCVASVVPFPLKSHSVELGSGIEWLLNASVCPAQMVSRLNVNCAEGSSDTVSDWHDVSTHPMVFSTAKQIVYVPTWSKVIC